MTTELQQQAHDAFAKDAQSLDRLSLDVEYLDQETQLDNLKSSIIQPPTIWDVLKTVPKPIVLLDVPEWMWYDTNYDPEGHPVIGTITDETTDALKTNRVMSVDRYHYLFLEGNAEQIADIAGSENCLPIEPKTLSDEYTGRTYLAKSQTTLYRSASNP